MQLYHNGGYTAEERYSYRTVIHSNLVSLGSIALRKASSCTPDRIDASCHRGTRRLGYAYPQPFEKLRCADHVNSRFEGPFDPKFGSTGHSGSCGALEGPASQGLRHEEPRVSAQRFGGLVSLLVI